MKYRYKKIRIKGRGLIDQHRLVMEISIGRRLESSEIVHHLNNNPLDNRIENLEITTRSAHAAYHQANGDLHRIQHDEAGRKLRQETMSIKYGKRVFICDKNKNKIMSVRSINLAAKVCKTTPGVVRLIIKGERVQCNGFTFETVA